MCVCAGADPGFWERGGLINIFTIGGGGGGMTPPVAVRGSGGARIAPPVGSGAKPQPLFGFCVDLAWISNTYTSRDIQIIRACMDGDEKNLHSSQCYGSYCSAAANKFVTESYCEFVTEACT